MGDIIWSKTVNFYAAKSITINNNVNRSDWLGFLDALGWMENNGKYGGVNAGGYAGIYQVGDAQLAYMNFKNGLGYQLLGITSKADVANNPVAQELAGIMEFRETPQGQVSIFHKKNCYD